VGHSLGVPMMSAGAISEVFDVGRDDLKNGNWAIAPSQSL